IFEPALRSLAWARANVFHRWWALSDEFLSHLEREVFPGGCFFAAVGAEFDTHPGRVRERIGVFIEEWVGELRAAAAAAQQAGELPPDPDPEQLIYEVDA